MGSYDEQIQSGDIDVSTMGQAICVCRAKANAPPGDAPGVGIRVDALLARIHGRQPGWPAAAPRTSIGLTPRSSCVVPAGLQCEAAELTYEALCRQLPQLSIGLVHGRMKSAEKDSAIGGFKNGETHILVATTVIEVGVDVPNASIMIIENPERLGLAQIHQLRGRVGRGARESFCILLVRNDLSSTARRRLEIIRSTQDGFAIAQQDLEIRGAGEVLGTRQTGDLSFRIADLIRDQKWFAEVEELAKLMQQPQYAAARTELMRNWIGDRQDYTVVG